VITTPEVRCTDPDESGASPGAARQGPEPERCPHGCVAAARTVTADQVDEAVAQLRERPNRSAVEQVQAVLRAFDLTVAPPVVIPDQR
jgi:hypothetical protein